MSRSPSTNTNPNNCGTCDHKTANPDMGWCYMFREEPKDVCMQHTGRESQAKKTLISLAMLGGFK